MLNPHPLRPPPCPCLEVVNTDLKNKKHHIYINIVTHLCFYKYYEQKKKNTKNYIESRLGAGSSPVSNRVKL